MAEPELNLKVTADISALQTGMAQAGQAVTTTAAKMEQSIEKMSRWEKFDRAMGDAGRATKRLNVAIDGMRAATLLATGDIEGALNALPGPFGQVAGAAFSLGGALHEAFTGAKAALAEAAEEMQKLEMRSGFKAQARDAERLLAIEQEADPIRKLELERQNALAIARKQARMAASEGAGHEAAAAAAAQERVINAQFDNKIREANTRLAKDQADADKRIADEAKRVADEAAKQAQERAKAMDMGRQILEDAETEKQIAMATDEATKRQLELEKDLRDIERERIANAKEMGDELARQIADAQSGMRIAKEQAELQDELKNAQKELGELQKQSRGGASVQSVDLGLAGSMRVGVQTGAQAVAAASEKQVSLQSRIATLVDQISRNTANLQNAGIR